MFTSLLGFEAIYQFKQKAFIGFSFIFLGLGYILGSQNFAPANVDFNSPYQISFYIVLLSLGCVFGIMFFAISGMLRDKQYNMESIIYCTSIKRQQFFMSRFTGVFLFSLFVFTMALVGFALGTLSPRLDPERVSAFNLGYYAWTWLIIVLPNVFICTSIIFSVSALTKNNIATYISAVFIYAAYFICSMFFNSPLLRNAMPPSPENMAIAALADPFGISAFFEQTQFWTPYLKNTELISFSGYFMWSRILWISISILILIATYKVFSFKKLNQKIKKKVTIEESNFVSKKYFPIKSILINAKAQHKSFTSLVKIELTNIYKSLPFIAIILIWIVIVASEIYSRINEGGAYNESLYPTTNLLIWLITDPLPFLSLLLIVFYSGELVWRERNLKFSGIIDATPANNGVFFLSKGLAIILLPMILITISILIAISFQIAGGYYDFEIWQYLSMFYYYGVTFIFYTSLALFIQSLLNNKYLGMVITGLVIMFFGGSLASLIGIEHPLLRIGDFPEIEYNNMTGYGGFSKPFHYYAIHWNVLGLILALLSFKLWQRGTIHKLSFRLKQLLSNWRPWYRISMIFFGAVFIISSGIIYYNTNVINEYATIENNLDFREEYERKYKQYENLKRLILVDAKTKMNIYPDENKFTLNADYILENISDTPIDTILISERASLLSLTLENAKLIDYDTIFNIQLFKLKEPLLFGQQLNFSFELESEKKGFENNIALVKNGSYIFQNSIEPSLGYNRGFEISSNFEREKRGLPVRKEQNRREDHILSDQSRDFKKISFETIVSTQSNQTAIAPGDLVKQWKENDRNYFHYKSPVKMMPAIAYFSANYKIKTSSYQNISIEQYYDSSHHFNINNIEQNTKETLAYCIANFGDYPFDHVRIAEIPGHYNFGGYAHPGTISMVEDNLYLIDNTIPIGFDLVAKRTIHEVAHQWWGHILTPKPVEGGSLLTEGFAKYTEAVVMEGTHGKRSIRQLSKTANSTYFLGRSNASEPEPAAYFSRGEGYLAYGKYLTIMLALKDLIGEEKVNTVLRILADRHRHDLKPIATSLEFLDEVYKVTPLEQHVLIDDWFKRIIIYDLAIEEASIKELDSGSYELSIRIKGKRFRQQDNGEAIEITINEPIQIGVFSAHPDNIEQQDILYLKAHQINSSSMELKIIVDQLPTHIAIDPFGTRTDENFIDNLLSL